MKRDTTPLSKLLKNWGKGAEYATEAAAMDEYSALARALEERVAELEGELRVSGLSWNMVPHKSEGSDVKAHEAEVTRLRADVMFQRGRADGLSTMLGQEQDANAALRALIAEAMDWALCTDDEHLRRILDNGENK